jgi:hypothetical protein
MQYSSPDNLADNCRRDRCAIHLDADIRFPQGERNDIHGIAEEIAIRVGQADHQFAAGGGIAVLVGDQGLGSAAATAAGGEGEQGDQDWRY